MHNYPIGTPGTPWSKEEKKQWRDNQTIKRSYRDEVISRMPQLPFGYDIVQYGALPYDTGRYPLLSIRPATFNPSLPTVLITGGVHGYETSGVQGALKFAREHLASWTDKCNFVIVPCVSPWGYETVNRWNPLALDPNRNFKANSAAPESALLKAMVDDIEEPVHMHIDLHETTDTDNTEFRPALAARDGTSHDIWNIPDGFYLVADSKKVELAFQEAIIHQVRQVTHIAPADEHGKIIGVSLLSDGVIGYDKKALFLCGGLTDAPYVTTTEVYPDSPQATAGVCNDAQVAAIIGGLRFILL
ncbi:M14 family metallocarboxypeptidase [Aestuariibacter sp. A3R04]|uniref:M14 family metallopeptidase n=1 Tax=Aestuariibacter sp. A3R04 TaxID=2841571 RepID=UPI001C090A93|nr:M14 family metallocarboxypeptidase [Aestuariibacter sp. A3R04]MBU3022492.1 M14 family metallocarboxypeptidase [Aestuariibacter sp. A3R04]